MATTTPKLIYKGNRANLPTIREANAFYLCEDTHELFFGTNLYTEAIRFYADEKPTAPAQGVLYINEITGAGDVWNGSAWVNVIKGCATLINDSADNTTVPTTKAAKDYIDEKVRDVVAGSIDGLGNLATKDEVSESDLEAKLKAKIDGKAEENDLNALDTRVTTAEDKLDVLIGEDADKSMRSIAAEELAAQLISETAKESLDTLAEIAKWIQEHPDDAAAMNEQISALQEKMSTLPDDVVAAVARITNLEARATTIEDTIAVGTF